MEQFVSSNRESSTSDGHKLFYNIHISVTISQETNQYAFKKRTYILRNEMEKCKPGKIKESVRSIREFFSLMHKSFFLMR